MTSWEILKEKLRNTWFAAGLTGSLVILGVGYGMYVDPNLNWLPVIGQPIGSALTGALGQAGTGYVGIGLIVVGAGGAFQALGWELLSS